LVATINRAGAGIAPRNEDEAQPLIRRARLATEG
jgi:hypothetical protein